MLLLLSMVCPLGRVDMMLTLFLQLPELASINRLGSAPPDHSKSLPSLFSHSDTKYPRLAGNNNNIERGLVQAASPHPESLLIGALTQGTLEA